MAKVRVILVCTGLVALLPVVLCGTIAVQNRDTTLDDLKNIDSYVSTAQQLDLPLLQKGFFIGTSQGPVLVKSERLPSGKSSPRVRPGYYNSLPRLIPAGFEGLSTSHFNLGAADPYKPLSSTRGLLPIPATAAVVPQQYVATQQTLTYPQQAYVQSPTGHQFQTYVTQGQVQAQQYASPTHQQHVSQEPNQQTQFYQNIPQQQQQQQFQSQPEVRYVQENSEQQLLPVDQAQEPYLRQQSQQVEQQYAQPEEQSQTNFPQQFLQSEQQQQQVQFSPQQQYANDPSQYIAQQRADSQIATQEPVQISARRQAPLDQPSFQVDNLLRQEDDQGEVQTYQTQVFGRERFESQQLLRNEAVLAASQQEENLPEGLRNRFYKNANLATILAQESLPVQGEQIINEWDTNKIGKGKIYALLSGAGLI